METILVCDNLVSVMLFHPVKFASLPGSKCVSGSSVAPSWVQALAISSLSLWLRLLVSGWQSCMCLRKLLTLITGSSSEHTMQ